MLLNDNSEGTAVGADTGIWILQARKQCPLCNSYGIDLYTSNRVLALVMDRTRRSGMLFWWRGLDLTEILMRLYENLKQNCVCVGGVGGRGRLWVLFLRCHSLCFWRKGILLRPGT